jgi:hypothetical protein
LRVQFDHVEIVPSLPIESPKEEDKAVLVDDLMESSRAGHATRCKHLCPFSFREVELVEVIETSLVLVHAPEYVHVVLEHESIVAVARGGFLFDENVVPPQSIS